MQKRSKGKKTFGNVEKYTVGELCVWLLDYAQIMKGTFYGHQCWRRNSSLATKLILQDILIVTCKGVCYRRSNSVIKTDKKDCAALIDVYSEETV